MILSVFKLFLVGCDELFALPPNCLKHVFVDYSVMRL